MAESTPVPPPIRLDTSGSVATITLDSPRTRNALSRVALKMLAGHLETIDRDPDVAVVHLRSASRVFCAGVDLGEVLDRGMEEQASALVALQRQMLALSKPIVTEVAGPVRGAGLALIGASDAVVASESADFAVSEVRLGLAPSIVSLTLLPRLTDRAAADLFLSARRVSAEEAGATGLVTCTVPDDDLADAVREVLEDIQRGHPLGLRETKKLLNRSILLSIERYGRSAASQSASLFASDTARGLIAEFLNGGSRAATRTS